MRGACRKGVQRSRSSDSSICRARAAGGTFSCCSVAWPSTPSGVKPWRSWNACSASPARRRNARARRSLRADRPRLPGAAPAPPGHPRPGPGPACDRATAAARSARQGGPPAHGSAPAPGAGWRTSAAAARPAARPLPLGARRPPRAARATVSSGARARHVEIGVDLARIHPPVSQVRQIPLQRRRERAVQLRLFRFGRAAGLAALAPAATERRGIVVARVQPLVGGRRQNVDRLRWPRPSAGPRRTTAGLGRQRRARRQGQQQQEALNTVAQHHWALTGQHARHQPWRAPVPIRLAPGAGLLRATGRARRRRPPMHRPCAPAGARAARRRRDASTMKNGRPSSRASACAAPVPRGAGMPHRESPASRPAAPCRAVASRCA